MPSSPEIALWGNGTVPPSATPRPVDVGGKAVSPKREKVSANSPTETMPAFVSQRTRDFVHIGREVGIFAILCGLFYFVLMPQNQQSIDNQKALQAANASLSAANVKWADIVDKIAANDARLQPTLQGIQEAVSNNTQETRKLRTKLEEFLDKK